MTPRSIHEIDIQITIVVVVEESATAAHAFGHIVRRIAETQVMVKNELARLGDIVEN